MKNFNIQWEALKETKTEDAPEVPKITKALPIIKWTEAFQDYLNQLSYSVLETVTFHSPTSFKMNQIHQLLFHYLQIDSLTPPNKDLSKWN